MTDEELKDKLNVTDDDVGKLMDQLAKVKNISKHMNSGSPPSEPLLVFRSLVVLAHANSAAPQVEAVVMDKKPTSGPSGAVTDSTSAVLLVCSSLRTI
jgi:hypothetical protein